MYKSKEDYNAYMRKYRKGEKNSQYRKKYDSEHVEHKREVGIKYRSSEEVKQRRHENYLRYKQRKLEAKLET
jgi:hypothetical protein